MGLFLVQFKIICVARRSEIKAECSLELEVLQYMSLTSFSWKVSSFLNSTVLSNEYVFLAKSRTTNRTLKTRRG